ncbi:MAG: NapC/NirT family cytochrome c [Gammaproteobacteria bacterium]|nr:NapC/NirT family cytochrome c [Gammaproteobacteria bacterium]
MTDSGQVNKTKTLWRDRLRKFLFPKSLRAALVLCATFFVAGIVFWGGFNTALDVTNTEKFCISCHEMNDYVYQEYQDTIHYNNRSGVRATCPDCHVPKEWGHKVVRKIQATNELFHKMAGTVDTPEKFEAKRLQLAENVWAAMKKTDSRECRNCHDFNSMDYMAQERRAVHQHDLGLESGKTCIDCHKGIAHSLPAMYGVDPDASAENGVNISPH